MAHSDFAAESGGYDPDEIYTKSQDQHGHSNNARVHVPPQWIAVIEQYIQSDDWPEYRTRSDVLRDALFHRLYWISQQKNRAQFPEVKAAIVREQYRKRLTRDAEREREIREFSKELDSQLTEMLQREEFALVQQYCEDLLDDMDAFATHPAAHERLVNQIHTYLSRAKNRW